MMHWLQGTKNKLHCTVAWCLCLALYPHSAQLMFMLHEVPSQGGSLQLPSWNALILLILSNYFETAYFWQSRLRCLNIERAAAGAGSGLLGDAFISQHLSIIL